MLLGLSVVAVSTWLAATEVDSACVTVRSDLPEEAASAQLYLDIAEEERAAGRLDPAKHAYREALRRDGGLVQARQGLEELCRKDASGGDAALVRQLESGQCAEALAQLDAIPEASRPQEPSTLLLEGICRYELEQDERADAVLTRAAADERLEDVAQLYRGLIASRQGRSHEAREWFQAAGARSTDARLRRVAEQLANDTGKGEKLSMVFVVDGGSDSNVALLPSGSPIQRATADGFAGMSMLASSYPWGARAPGIQLLGQLRKQMSTAAFDVAQGGLWLS